MTKKNKEPSIISIVITIIVTFFFVVLLITIPGNVKRGNPECPTFSNSTYDPSIPVPFSDKCIGLTNYIKESKNGHREVKRGLVIR